MSNKQEIEKAFETSQNQIIDSILEAIKDNFDLIHACAQMVVHESEKLDNIFSTNVKILNARQLIAQQIKKTKDQKKNLSVTEYTAILQNFQSQKKQLEADVTYQKVIDELLKQRQILQEAIENFQYHIGALRNQTFKVFYLITKDDGTSPTVVTAPLEWLVSYSYSPIDKKIKLKFNKTFNQIDKEIETVVSNLSSLLTTDEPAIIQLENFNTKDLDDAYTATYQRWDSDYIEPKEQRTKKKRKEIVAVFLHHIMFYYILNKGDIAEGYLSFYFSGRKLTSKNKEEKIQQFITEGVLPVNNQSGFLQEDFQKEIVGFQTIQGAAKALKANVGGIDQIIALADKIANATSKEEMLREDIEKFIYTSSTSGIRNGFIGEVESAIDEVTDAALEKAVQEIETQLGKKGGLKTLRSAPLSF